MVIAERDPEVGGLQVAGARGRDDPVRLERAGLEVVVERVAADARHAVGSVVLVERVLVTHDGADAVDAREPRERGDDLGLGAEVDGVADPERADDLGAPVGDGRRQQLPDVPLRGGGVLLEPVRDGATTFAR